MEGEKLVFVHAPSVAQQGMAESMAPYIPPPDMSAQHPMIGALKGLLWIDPALDLTQPALDPEEWERALDEKYGKGERGT
jgi:hypothetical protein